MNACQTFEELPDREEQEDLLFNFLHLLDYDDLPEVYDEDEN